MDFPLANTYGSRSELFLQSADDYHRQRHRINKRLNRLRRNLKIITKDTKNYKEKCKGNTTCAENYDMDTAYGDLSLYQIERDLLYAQETRLLLDVHTSKSKERFLITKYKKALKNAHHLLSVIANEQDQFKVLEFLTYTAIIEGSLAITRKKYNDALFSFSVARCSLQFLYAYRSLPPAFTKELYYDIIDLVVDPALKVAALQTKSSKISDLTQLSREQVFNNRQNTSYLNKAMQIIDRKDPSYITPSSEEQGEVLREITWGSYTARVSSNEISLAITKVNEKLKQIIDADTSSYDSALMSYLDAITLQEQEMERNENDSDDSENQEQYIILTYLKYNYLLLRIRRDFTIMEDLDAGAAEKSNASRQKLLDLWKDYLKVNDSILDSFNELKELPGIANDDEIMEMVTTLDVFFQIKKQMKLSLAYLVSNEYVKSLALVSNCSQLANNLKTLSDAEELSGNLPRNSDFEKIKEEIANEKSKLYILASYFKGAGELASIGSKFLIDYVKKFPEFSSAQLLESVAPLRVNFEPVNVKPVLFDIGYNYIKYDSMDGRVASQKSVDEPLRENMSDESIDRKKKGFFGLFGR